MTTFKLIRNILILLVAFASGVILSYTFLVEGDYLETITRFSGGNVFAPLAVLISATIASIAAYAGLRENNERHLKEQTIKVLHYKRYTWSGIRAVIDTLAEITAKSKEMDESQFDDYMQRKRQTDRGVIKVVSFLDSYQDVAFGINNGIYHEPLAKLMVGRQLCFIYKNSQSYINWRRNSSIDGPASHAGLFADLESLTDAWSKEFS